MMVKSDTELFIGTMMKFNKLALKYTHMKEIPRGEFALLHFISENSAKQKIAISDLSEALLISKPAVSQIVNILEYKGFIERTASKKDRRVVYVDITQSGVEIVKKTYEDALLRLSYLLEKLGKDDCDELMRIINKLYSIIDYTTKGSEG